VSQIRPPSTPFEIHLERRSDAVLVKLVGEFDLAAKPAFEEGVKELSLDPPAELILDLRGVTFIDSSGLRLVLDLWSESRRDGFDFAVLPGSDQVQRVFEAVGLNGELPIIEGVPPAGPDGVA
jgi:anti-sigma B factor antagonist